MVAAPVLLICERQRPSLDGRHFISERRGLGHCKRSHPQSGALKFFFFCREVKQSHHAFSLMIASKNKSHLHLNVDNFKRDRAQARTVVIIEED